MSIPTLNRQRGSSMACATATWPVYLKDGYAWSAMTSPTPTTPTSSTASGNHRRGRRGRPTNPAADTATGRLGRQYVDQVERGQDRPGDIEAGEHSRMMLSRFCCTRSAVMPTD